MTEDKVTAQERLARQDWSGVAKTGLSSMAPAEKGWVLAVVIIIAALEVGDHFTTREQYAAFEGSMNRMSEYLALVETSRASMEENRSQEIRRMQEVNKELSQALGRRHEYEGRAAHEEKLLGNEQP